MMVSMQSHVPKIAGSNPQICKMYGGKKEKIIEKKIFCLRQPGPGIMLKITSNIS